MIRMTHGIVSLGRCRREMMIPVLDSFEVDRVGMMLVSRMRRSFAHAAVRQHENAGQQHDDHTAHAKWLTAALRSGNVVTPEPHMRREAADGQVSVHALAARGDIACVCAGAR